MPNSDDKIKTIDVKKVLESKLGSKVRFVPKCVLNWLRKILHEDEINEYLDEVKDIKGVLCCIAERFGEKTLLDRRRTDALIADLFPKESAVRRLAHIALYDGCAQKLWAVRGKPFEVRSAAAASAPRVWLRARSRPIRS